MWNTPLLFYLFSDYPGSVIRASCYKSALYNLMTDERLYQRFNLYSEEIAGISLRQFVSASRESLCIVANGCCLLLAVYLQRGSLGICEIESSLHALSKCESD